MLQRQMRDAMDTVRLSDQSALHFLNVRIEMAPQKRIRTAWYANWRSQRYSFPYNRSSRLEPLEPRTMLDATGLTDASYDLGVVSYFEQSDLDLTGGDKEYSLSTPNRGTLTIQLESLTSPQKAGVSLFGQDDRLLTSSSSIDGMQQLA